MRLSHDGPRVFYVGRCGFLGNGARLLFDLVGSDLRFPRYLGKLDPLSENLRGFFCVEQKHKKGAKKPFFGILE
jgi:hypothetical protein